VSGNGSVIRPGDVLGPSVAAISIGAGSTGQRADLLVCDDIVDVKAIASKADRERTSRYFHENLMNLLEPDGRVWCLFTPWHTDDLNGRLKRNSAFGLFRRPIGNDLEPVWPEHWSRERLAERRRAIGEVAFARACRLQCIADDEVPIQANWMRFWVTPAEYELTVLAIDPAVSTKARADASALVVLGRATTNEVHCLEAIAHRFPDTFSRPTAKSRSADLAENPGRSLQLRSACGKFRYARRAPYRLRGH